MPKPIKYNNSTKTAGCCIQVNNFDIGVLSTYPYGPTSSTDFWAGYNVPSGGFVSFQNKLSQGPSIYSIPDVSSLIRYGENLNIGPVNTPEDVILQSKLDSDIALVNIEYPELPQIDNNIFTIDAGYTGSYPWKAGSWYDISGANNVQAADLQGGTLWVSGTSINNYTDSYFRFNASQENNFFQSNPFLSPLTEFTISVWFNAQSTANFNNRVNLYGQTLTNNNGVPLNDCNFSIRGNGSGGFEGVVRIAGTNYTVNGGTISTNTWHNVVFICKGVGNDLEIWVDNVLMDSLPLSSTPNSNGQQTLIGGNTSGTVAAGAVNYFNGFISVVNVYDQALDSGSLGVLYNRYVGRY